MDLPIIEGIDGSEPSLRAVDWAADEAALRGAGLRLVYASVAGSDEGACLAHDLEAVGGGDGAGTSTPPSAGPGADSRA